MVCVHFISKQFVSLYSLNICYSFDFMWKCEYDSIQKADIFTPAKMVFNAHEIFTLFFSLLLCTLNRSAKKKPSPGIRMQCRRVDSTHNSFKLNLILCNLCDEFSMHSMLMLTICFGGASAHHCTYRTRNYNAITNWNLFSFTLKSSAHTHTRRRNVAEARA